MSTVALKSGDTIWGLVKAKLGAGASNADIQNATQKVLDANGETWDSAKTMRAGEEVNLGVLDPKPAAAETPAAAGADPNTPTPNAPATENALGELEQQQLAQLGLGSLPPSLAQLLNTVYESTDPSISPFLSSLGFDPQALVNGATPNGAVNTPGARPGAGPSFGGLSNFLNSQGGINPNNTNQLAFNTGSFVNQLSGIQFTAFDPARILAQFPGLVG